MVEQQVAALLLPLKLLLFSSFCELVNSLLQQAEDLSPKLDHLPEGVLEVRPPLVRTHTHVKLSSAHLPQQVKN